MPSSHVHNTYNTPTVNLSSTFDLTSIRCRNVKLHCNHCSKMDQLIRACSVTIYIYMWRKLLNIVCVCVCVCLVPSGTLQHYPPKYLWSAVQRGCIYSECCPKPDPSDRNWTGCLPTAECCPAALHRRNNRVRLYSKGSSTRACQRQYSSTSIG